MKFEPDEYDRKFGEMFVLPKGVYKDESSGIDVDIQR